MKNALHDPIWFTPPNGSSRVLWKDAPAAPAAPDYTGAAQATAAGNLAAAQQATKANRVNQYSPYGSSVYSQADPNDPNSAWSQNISLSPTGQQLLDNLNQSQLGVGALQQGATSNVADKMGQPFNYTGPQVQGSVNQPNINTSFDTSGVAAIPAADAAARQNAEDKAYQAATSRLDPQWNQRTQMQETQLRNQGLAPGSEAYTNAMRDFNYGRNDAYTQAQANAVNQGLANQQAQFGMGLQANQTGFNQAQAQGTFGNQAAGQQFNQGLASGNFNNQAAQNALAQQMALYNQPLNTLNALRSSSQVTNPQFANVPQQQTTTGPNYSGATQSQGQYDMGLYNSGVGQANSFNNGLMSIAGSALGGFF